MIINSGRLLLAELFPPLAIIFSLQRKTDTPINFDKIFKTKSCEKGHFCKKYSFAEIPSVKLYLVPTRSKSAVKTPANASKD